MIAHPPQVPCIWPVSRRCESSLLLGWCIKYAYPHIYIKRKIRLAWKAKADNTARERCYRQGEFGEYLFERFTYQTWQRAESCWRNDGRSWDGRHRGRSRICGHGSAHGNDLHNAFPSFLCTHKMSPFLESILTRNGDKTCHHLQPQFNKLHWNLPQKTTSRGTDWGAFLFFVNIFPFKMLMTKKTKSSPFLQILGKNLILGHYFLSKNGEKFGIVYSRSYQRKCYWIY